MVRIPVGIAIGILAWALVFVAPPVVVQVAVGGLMILALREFYAIASACNLRSFAKAGYAAALIWLIVPAPALDRGLVLSILAIALLGAGVLARLPTASVLPTVGTTVAGVLYIAAPLYWATVLRAISPHWLAFALVVTAIGDTAALAVGKTMGRHKLAPGLSPHKTWEGTVAATVVGTVAGAGYAAWFLAGETSAAEAATLALALNALGQIGDLAQSAMKRAAGLKDSGSLLPGHGGVLDRIDGLLFVIPVLYGYLQYLR